MDYDREAAIVKVHVADLNAGNIAAQLTLQSNFGAAINGIVGGTLQRIRYGNEVVSLYAAPVDPSVQRELRWRVDFRDTVTGKPSHFTIPTADVNALDPNNRKYAYIGDADVVDAFVTAAEAYVLSDDGNPIEILDLLLKGKNV
jgi:hypothetical protein